jgi:hypothetical protein
MNRIPTAEMLIPPVTVGELARQLAFYPSSLILDFPGLRGRTPELLRSPGRLRGQRYLDVVRLNGSGPVRH